jgi:MFS family permease
VTAGGFGLFRRRAFALYLAARLFSALAAQMIIIAVGWQVYHLTGRVLDLGFVGLSQFLPFLCLSLVAGHAADRYDRRRIILSCLAVVLLCALLLLEFARRGNGSVAPIFAVLALLGTARAFMMPASQSFLPNIVPLAVLGDAVAINSSAFQLANIVGPSLGGLVYAYGESSKSAPGGAQWVYGGAAALLGAAVLMLFLVDSRGVAAGGSIRFSWGHLLEGLRFTWHRKTVLGAISLDLFAVLFGGASALLPAFTRDVLHAGPEVFGYLRGARSGRRGDGDLAGGSADHPPSRGLYVRGRRPIRGGDHGFRPDAADLGSADGSVGHGRGRHGQRVRARAAGAARNARRHPRTGECGQFDRDRRLERARGIRIRDHRRLVRAGSSDRSGRRSNIGGGDALGEGIFSHVVAIADFPATQGPGNGWHITDLMKVTTPTPARTMIMIMTMIMPMTTRRVMATPTPTGMPTLIRTP